MGIRQKYVDQLRDLTEAAEAVVEKWESSRLDEAVTFLAIEAGCARELLNEWDNPDDESGDEEGPIE